MLSFTEFSFRASQSVDAAAETVSNVEKIREAMGEVERRLDERNAAEAVEETAAMKAEEDEEQRLWLQKAFERENIAFKERLASELTESRTRELVEENWPFLESVRAGKTESARHEAYEKGGADRRALTNCMITHPYTELHLRWIYEELKVIKPWCPR